jgi:ketosteroid isomerase-like protein
MTETEQVVHEYVDAVNAGDLERVLALLHPDVELHEAETLPGAVHAIGFAAVRHYLERFSTHWTAARWEPLELRFAGDRGVLVARLHLTGRESGIVVDREWSYVLTVRDGKLLRQDGYDDRETAFAALSA